MSREIVIGDIHGCYNEFIELLDKVDVSDDDFIISVGDIVDRGPDSIKVYEFFRNRQNSKVLIGNHERKHLNAVLSYAQEITKLKFGEQYNEFLNWLQGLDYYYESEHAIIVHAALEDGVELSGQRTDVLCGSTAGEKYLEKKYMKGYWHSYYTGDKPVIFGHHVTGDTPLIIDNRIFGIDTGACHGGKLTAVVLPDLKLYSVKSGKNYWVEEMKKWQLEVLRAKPWETFRFGKIEKEIERFRNSENKEVIDFINGLSSRMTYLNSLVDEILEGLKEKVNLLIETHGLENFNKEADKYEHKIFLFLAKSGKLDKQNLERTLSSPINVIELAKQLGIPTDELEEFLEEMER